MKKINLEDLKARLDTSLENQTEDMKDLAEDLGKVVDGLPMFTGIKRALDESVAANDPIQVLIDLFGVG